jgi:integrase
MKLKTDDVRAAQPRDKSYRLSDGAGLSLLVMPNGSKLWQWIFKENAKTKTVSIGPFPEVSLKDAREAVFTRRAKKRMGETVVPQRKITFEQLFREHLNVWETGKVGRHVDIVKRRIEQDALPEIGAMRLDQIKPADVIAMIRKVEQRGALDVSRRLRQKVSEIFGYGIAMGYCDTDPAARVGVALRPRPRVEHMAKVDVAEMPALLRAIDGYGYPVVRAALKWTILTAARTTETREARWSEIREGVWVIPDRRMKMNREHRVPLSKQALAVLEELKAHRRGEYLFPGPRRPTINANALIYALYDLENGRYRGRQTVHGFRGLFSTYLNEQGFNRDWIEMALAHSDNTVRGAYNAAQYIEQRKTILQFWADRLDEWRIEGMWE